MIAQKFPEQNTTFGPPEGLDESHVHSIPAHVGVAERGAFEGGNYTIVAWKPDISELAQLMAGGNVYLIQMGGLSPHFIATDFQTVKNVGIG